MQEHWKEEFANSHLPPNLQTSIPIVYNENIFFKRLKESARNAKGQFKGTEQTNKLTEQTHTQTLTCLCCIVYEAERSHSCDACCLELFHCHGFQCLLSDLLPGKYLRVAVHLGGGEAH